MNQVLQKHDIVGKRIDAILQTPSQVYSNEDDIEVCRLFTILDNGVAFELIYTEDEHPSTPITSANVTKIASIPARVLGDRDFLTPEEIQLKVCGQPIMDVIISKLWASFGLLLPEMKVLYLGANSTYVTWIGAVLDTLWQPSDPMTFVSYWERSPVFRSDFPDSGLGGNS